MWSQDSLRNARRGSFDPEVQILTRKHVIPVKPVTPRSRILALSTSHHTCIHMVWHHLGFGGIPTLRSPRFGETLTRWRKVKLSVYPHDRRRKGVDKWKFLLACVRVVHRNIQNQDLPQLFTRFPPVHPKSEFRAISPETN